VLIFFHSNPLFVHDLSRPHSHARYPVTLTRHITKHPPCSVRYTSHYPRTRYLRPLLQTPIYPVSYTPSIVTHNDARCLPPFSIPHLPSRTLCTVVHPLVYTLMNRSWMDFEFRSSSSSSSRLVPHLFHVLANLPPHSSSITPPLRDHRRCACRYLFRCSLVFYLSACHNYP